MTVRAATLEASTVETSTSSPVRRRSGAAFAVLLLVAGCGFVALGVWQLERMQWKRELIARVDARVHAPGVEAPRSAQWAGVTRDRDEYRRVVVSGRWSDDRETLVAATTALGSGYWVLTPLVADDGTAVLVNRGFVPPEFAAPGSRPAPPIGRVAVTGLLRITEPGGGFLRSNDPAANRWYSRDVDAIARMRGLGPTAPFFVDAEAPPGQARAERGPVPGLTVVAFRDAHLQYALTWFALAAACVVGEVVRRRHAPGA